MITLHVHLKALKSCFKKLLNVTTVRKKENFPSVDQIKGSAIPIDGSFIGNSMKNILAHQILLMRLLN